MVAKADAGASAGHATLDRMAPEQAVHPDLGPLAALLGDWHGEGEGRWGGGEPFRYREWVTFSHNGKPFLAYSQRTLGDGGKPLHAETGFWRPVADGSVEVVITHPIGVVEIELGRWAGTGLTLRTASIVCTPTAKTVTGLQREFDVAGDVLRYRLRMATDGGEPQPHLRAELHRVPADAAAGER